MYCPNCGKENEQANVYCRACGFSLPDLNKKNMLVWGGATPAEQVRTSLVLNLISAVLSLIVGILLLSTMDNRGDKTFIISLAAGLLLTISLWQAANFTVGMKLRNHLKKRTDAQENDSPKEIAGDATTKELLPEADSENVVPASVTEKTTSLLHEKTPRKINREQD